jgi:glycosyltransferase involved in cell wall biosynthesis
MSPHIEITGFLPQSEALARVQQADVCLSPFYPTPMLLSTSPTKLVEYLALARPVVANNHPEQSLILRESRAGVCVPWGARYFARAVRWLMARTQDERLAMGERGREWVVKNRSYARIADDIERAVSRILPRHAGE